MYVITICDGMFGKFSGEFEGTHDEAVEAARNFYAMELDTDSEHIEILSIVECEKTP